MIYVFSVTFLFSCVKLNLSIFRSLRWMYYVLSATFHVTVRVLEGIFHTLVSYLMDYLSHAFLVVLKLTFCRPTVQDWTLFVSCLSSCVKLNFLYGITLKRMCSISDGSLLALNSTFGLPVAEQSFYSPSHFILFSLNSI